MNIMRLSTSLMSATMISLSAFAQEVKPFGIFVEPLLALQKSETSVDYPAPFSNSTGSADGYGLGARFGFHASEVIFLAIDTRATWSQFKDSALNYESPALATNWGTVVGVQMPNFGLRVWGTYVFGGDLNPELKNGLDVKFQDSTGYRIGAGLRMLMLSVNLEYQDIKYGSAQLEQLGSFSPGSTFKNVALNDKAWILSLSFPLQL